MNAESDVPSDLDADLDAGADLDAVAETDAEARSDAGTDVAEGTQAAAADESPKAPRRVILVVEDDPFAARLVVRALRNEPTQVEVAGDAREAISILSRAQARVILMDVQLPGTDGVALTALLKANPTLRDIPVVMVTSDATRNTLVRSMQAGAAGFIVKPFDRAGLLAKLSPYLS